MRRTAKNTVLAAGESDVETLHRKHGRVSQNTFEALVPSRVVRSFMLRRDFARIGSRGRVRILSEGLSLLMNARQGFRRVS